MPIALTGSFRALRADARHFQIATLATLLALNLAVLHSGVTPLQVAVSIGAALASQYLFGDARGIAFDWRSALITGCSLSLLLRTANPALWALAAVLAIGSKFLLRIDGKHLFNPANFAIVALLSWPVGVTVNAGHPGDPIWLVALIATLAGLVLTRAGRLDVTAAFLGSYGLLMLGQCLMSGEPASVALARLQSGAILVFACFMITDPRSTPNSRVARLVFAAGVGVLAWTLRWQMGVTSGVWFALAGLSLMTPVLDRVMPARRFEWRMAAA